MLHHGLAEKYNIHSSSIATLPSKSNINSIIYSQSKSWLQRATPW